MITQISIDNARTVENTLASAHTGRVWLEEHLGPTKVHCYHYAEVAWVRLDKNGSAFVVPPYQELLSRGSYPR